jgi:hypothetical protein
MTSSSRSGCGTSGLELRRLRRAFPLCARSQGQQRAGQGRGPDQPVAAVWHSVGPRAIDVPFARPAGGPTHRRPYALLPETASCSSITAAVALVSVDDLGLWEAWTWWFQGVPLDSVSLWGVPILWWGRIGKTAAFLGGMTVILDIVGPESIRAFGRRVKTTGAEDVTFTIAGIGAAAMLGFIIVPLLVWPFFGREGARIALVAMATLIFATLFLLAYPKVIMAAILGFARLLENPLAERIVRTVGVVFLLAGFHFDLLAT